MDGAVVAWLVVLALVVFGIAMAGRKRTYQSRPGPGAVGAVYDLLNEDKRKAIELVVEEKAEARDPETADDKPVGGGR